VRELRQQKTLIVSTHILQEVEAIADRVLVIHNGRLVFDGAPLDSGEPGSLEQRFHQLTC
jgi:ABC-2 type transport system ATP-binding protein